MKKVNFVWPPASVAHTSFHGVIKYILDDTGLPSLVGGARLSASPLCLINRFSLAKVVAAENLTLSRNSVQTERV